MWIKFDGKSAIITIPESGLKVKTEFIIDKWYHLVEHDNKLYLNGDEKDKK